MTAVNEDNEEVTEMLLRFGWGEAPAEGGAPSTACSEPTEVTPHRSVEVQCLDPGEPLEGVVDLTELQVTGSWDEVPLERLATGSGDPEGLGTRCAETTMAVARPVRRRAPPPPAPPPPPWPDTGLGPTSWWLHWAALAAAPIALFIAFLGEASGS